MIEMEMWHSLFICSMFSVDVQMFSDFDPIDYIYFVDHEKNINFFIVQNQQS